MQVNLSGLPNVPMRVLTIVVFVLVTWATVGGHWLGLSYILANYFVVLLGLWSERDNPSPVPVQFFFFGMLFTLLNDVISIGIMYDPAYTVSGVSDTRSTFRFNAAMCIILIIVKPVLCLFIYKEWQERVGGGEHIPNDSNYERLGGQSGGYNQGPTYGGYGEKTDNPPQYQPPPSNQPFP